MGYKNSVYSILLLQRVYLYARLLAYFPPYLSTESEIILLNH